MLFWVGLASKPFLVGLAMKLFLYSLNTNRKCEHARDERTKLLSTRAVNSASSNKVCFFCLKKVGIFSRILVIGNVRKRWLEILYLCARIVDQFLLTSSPPRCRQNHIVFGFFIKVFSKKVGEIPQNAST